MNFSNMKNVAPICLSHGDVLEKPLCPDDSHDRDATKKEIKEKKVNGRNNKMLGGCVTVAGWGNRYSYHEMEDLMSNCMTDFNSLSPDKIE